MTKLGRPSMFTEGRRAIFLAALRASNVINSATQLAGWKRDTLARYLRRGRHHEAVGLDTEFAKFSRATRLAIRENENDLLAKIKEAATGTVMETVTKSIKPVLDGAGLPRFAEDGSPLVTVDQRTETRKEFDWRAAAWLLSCRHRSRYGRHMDHSGKVQHAHNVKFSEEEERAINTIVARRLGSVPTGN